MFYQVGLSQIFNHKIVYNDEDFQRCRNFSPKVGTQYGHFTEKNFPKEDFEAHGVVFKAPIIGIDQFDNIACEGQIISIPPQKVSKIYSVGFCEIGRFTENIACLNDKKIVSNSKVFFYQFGILGNTIRTYDIQSNNCKIALTDKKTVEDAWLYYYESLEIKTNSEIDALVLPDNPFLHIMALTLKLFD